MPAHGLRGDLRLSPIVGVFCEGDFHVVGGYTQLGVVVTGLQAVPALTDVGAVAIAARRFIDVSTELIGRVLLGPFGGSFMIEIN